MDPLRLLLTLFAGVAVIAAAGWTMAARRAHEAEEARGHEAETIRDLAAQLQAAGRHLRRLAVLERAQEERVRQAGILEAFIARVRGR